MKHKQGYHLLGLTKSVGNLYKSIAVTDSGRARKEKRKRERKLKKEKDNGEIQK